MGVRLRQPASSNNTPKSHRSQQWLHKGGLARDDSDDELGVEDHPWEWIYGESDTSKTPTKSTSKNNVDHTPSRKRKADLLEERPIVGARMGTFTCKVGDAVLLKSPEEGQDWAGLICAFSEVNDDDEEEMCVNIMWFVSPQELGKGRKDKNRAMNDAMANEQYITLDFNINPLRSINGSATVLSKAAFMKKYPKGPPKGKTALARYKKCIMCRRGVKQRTRRFTEEFTWNEIYKGPESLLGLLELIQQQTKGRRKKDEVTMPKEDPEEPQEAPEPVDSTPATPQKRRKTTAATPKSSTKSTKYSTPTHKRIIIKKPLEFTPLGTRVLSPSTVFSSPYQQARSILHVSSVPASLTCRETEFSTVYTHLSAAISEGTGACIYISGTPGTGKTATVREVVSQLSLAIQSEELDDFSFVEINGMKVTDPHQSYSLLWEALKGDRVSPSHALDLLEREFSTPSPRRIPCVVLMDELDQLVTKNQSVMYNFFNWPALRHSRLIVLAVANTMDLPERTLSNKINSRLGMTRITFPGYSHTQLMSIIQARLENVPGNIVDPDAVQFAARKVAAVSGDARRALDICRRAVEIAEQQYQQQQNNLLTKPDTMNIDKENANPTTTQSQPRPPTAPLSSLPNPPPTSTTITKPTSSGPRVTIATIKHAISESTSSPLHVHLRSLPLSQKLFLSAFLSVTRRTGLPDTTLGTVFDQATITARMVTAKALVGDIAGLLLHGSKQQLVGMRGAVEGLVEAGILGVEGGRRAGGQGQGWERAARCRLRIGQAEIREGLTAAGGDGEGEREIGRALGFDA